MKKLGSQTLRDIAHWKPEGYTNVDVANRRGISVHAVGRKLRGNRVIWSEEPTA